MNFLRINKHTKVFLKVPRAQTHRLACQYVVEPTSMEDWVGMKCFVLRSGYNAPTLFLNLQMRSLACRELDIPLWCWPLEVTDLSIHFYIVFIYYWTCFRPEYIWNATCWVLSNNQRISAYFLASYISIFFFN
jgi:hypothetical protein